MNIYIFYITGFAETLQIPAVFESSHLVKNSLNYGGVNTVDMFTILPTTRKSWLSKYDIRVVFLKLKIFLVLQYRHIIHLFEDEALQFTVVYGLCHLVQYSLNYQELKTAQPLKINTFSVFVSNFRYTCLCLNAKLKYF